MDVIVFIVLFKIAFASVIVVGNTTAFRFSPVTTTVAKRSAGFKSLTNTTPNTISHHEKDQARNLKKLLLGSDSPRHKTPNGIAVTIWAIFPEQTTTTAFPSFKPLVCENKPSAVIDKDANKPIKKKLEFRRFAS